MCGGNSPPPTKPNKEKNMSDSNVGQPLYEVEIKREQSCYFSQEDADFQTIEGIVSWAETSDIPLQYFHEVETITVYDLDGNKVYMQERVVQ